MEIESPRIRTLGIFLFNENIFCGNKNENIPSALDFIKDLLFIINHFLLNY